MTRASAVACVLAASLAAVVPVSAQWRPGGPMRIVLLVDSSSAVGPMLTPFRAGLNGFLDDLQGEPEVTIISTGGQLRVRIPPTTDRDKLHSSAAQFASDGGGNSFLDTMLEADRRFLKSAPGKRPVFVVLITDSGESRGGERIDDYNKFVNDFRSRGGRAHAIVVKGTISGIATQIAENLAHNTGGFFETVAIANAVPRTMKALVERLAADQ
jgi:von Willebrand factor type A domain